MIYTVIAIVAAVALLATIVVLVTRSLLKNRAAMREFDAQFHSCTLPAITTESTVDSGFGREFPFSFAGPGFNVNANWLVIMRALALALRTLRQYGFWDDAMLFRALEGVRIYVKDVDEWVSVWDPSRSVAGQAFVEINVVCVGPGFTALFHELAHLARYKTAGDPGPDALHMWPFGGDKLVQGESEYLSRIAP